MDYMYQSVFFAYFLFALLTGLTLYFFIASRKQGYWGENSEEPKHRMMQDEDEGGWRG
jgi:hypothetical protein